jgi:chitin disaccharide deacetylase
MDRPGRITMITRADDCGNSHEANLGILQELEAGILKNISLMAPGRFIEEAAAFFAGRPDICFGLHAVLNADGKPLLPAGQVPSLVDENGFFLPTPAFFSTQHPMLDEIIAEFQAQLEKLRSLGFLISYIDTHWLIEYQIPGLEERLNLWAASQNLLYHAHYCTTVKQASNTGNLIDDTVISLQASLPGQYLFVAHPALGSPELGLFSDHRILGIFRERAIMPIRYDQAVRVTDKIPPLHEWFAQ